MVWACETSQLFKANNTWSTELIYSQFLTTEFTRLWVNSVAKSMLPNLWQVVPRWIRYCFSMRPILLRCSSETVRKGWVAVSSNDNCCLFNSVNAVLVDSEHVAHWHFLKQLLQHEGTSFLLFVSHDPRYVITGSPSSLVTVNMTLYNGVIIRVCMGNTSIQRNRSK